MVDKRVQGVIMQFNRINKGYDEEGRVPVFSESRRLL